MASTHTDGRRAAVALANTTAYGVTILYREPTYELRVGKKAEPYRFSYVVTAASGAMARSLALDEFRAMAALSGSGWVREVVDVIVRTVKPR